jgi:hypothetical protein
VELELDCPTDITKILNSWASMLQSESQEILRSPQSFLVKVSWDPEKLKLKYVSGKSTKGTSLPLMLAIGHTLETMPRQEMAEETVGIRKRP